MLQRDTRDFVVAFAIGAVVGAAAALLLRGEAPSAAERVWRSLEPNRREVRRRVDRARRSFEEGVAESVAARDAIRAAGRELLHEIGNEVASKARDAKKELLRGIRFGPLGGRSRGARVLRVVAGR